jgi:hypothetical protein
MPAPVFASPSDAALPRNSKYGVFSTGIIDIS